MSTQPAEIDGVLSSIRRLIAETRPAQPAPSGDSPTAQAAPRRSDAAVPALVLSPAQLVAPPPQPPKGRMGQRPRPQVTRVAPPPEGQPHRAAQETTATSADHDLAERLADVVRAQIAQTLPEQIAGLAPHLMDEAILRPIVAEMIRKELAGPLGERITRNVRKLVRQEVHSAIALRRLE